MAGVTDSKTNDIQSGIEKASTLITAALSGYNLIYSAAGTINSVLTSSLQGIAVDDELYGYVRHILKGIDFSSEKLHESVELIAKVAHSGKSFLTERHTKDNLRQEHWLPEITDRRRYEIFEQSDQKGMLDFAKEKAKRILEEHSPMPIPKDSQAKIDAVVERAQNR